MTGRGLGGGPLWKMIVEHYYKCIIEDGLDKSAREKSKKEFISKLLGDRQVADGLSGSMKLARELVDTVEESLRGAGYSVARLDFVLLDRGLVGAGSGVFKTVFEVGMEVDSLLGLPYYPGSTLKGAARAVCEDLLEESLEDSCDALFGSTKGSSRIIYTAAYPIGCKEDLGPCTVYLLDVITPHYYKEGQAVEAEYEATPVPVLHLSISPGTVFSTVVAVDSERAVRDERLEKLVKELSSYSTGLAQILESSPAEAALKAGLLLLESALTTGIGARSGKGYNVAMKLDSREGLTLEVLRLNLKWPQR